MQIEYNKETIEMVLDRVGSELNKIGWFKKDGEYMYKRVFDILEDLRKELLKD